MFGPAQANSLCPEITGCLCIKGRFCIGAHRHPAHIICPSHQRTESAGQGRLDGGHLTGINLACAAINGQHITCLIFGLAQIDCAIHHINTQLARPGNARPAHTTGNHRRMACHTASCRQNPGSGVHAMNIFRTGFKPHKNDFMSLPCQCFGGISCQTNLATCGAG